MISKQIEMGKTNLQLELDQFALGPACPQVFGLLWYPSSLHKILSECYLKVFPHNSSFTAALPSR